MKARHIKEVKKFTDMPNVGKRVVSDFGLLGINNPKDLAYCDPLDLYKKLCRKTNTRQDPCVLDVFMATVDFAKGAPARPWFYYTKLRKQKFPNI